MLFVVLCACVQLLFVACPCFVTQSLVTQCSTTCIVPVWTPSAGQT